MCFTFSCQQKLGPHANVGFSKAMSAGWLQMDKTAEGGPRVMRKVRPTQDIPGKNVYSGNENWFKSLDTCRSRN